MAKKSSSKKSGQAAKKRSATKKFWIKVKLSLWLGIILGSLGCLVWVLNLPYSETDTRYELGSPEKTRQRPDSFSTPPGEKGLVRRDKTRTKDVARLYEEQDIKKISQITREIDLAILQSLVLIGAGSDTLEHTKLRWRWHQGEKYLFQKLEIRLDISQKRHFLDSLEDYLDKWMDYVSLEPVTEDKGIWQVVWHKVPTHNLEFQKEGREEIVSKMAKEKPFLAIVIDDLGEDYQTAKKIIGLVNGQVTYSILPYCTYTQEIVELVRQKDLDFMLHLPMEPVNYPEIDPGPGSLFVNMSGTRIRDMLQDDLEQVPGSIGVSNHMGSRFTADREDMSVVFQELKKRRLCFLDSLTSPKSVARELAEKEEVAMISRDIFLDNKKNVNSIVFQLKKAEQLAIQRGWAVAIGHPYPETVKALAKWMEEKDSRVTLCQIGRLINMKRMLTVNR